MSEACPRCGIRADIGCKHQPAHGRAPVQEEPRRDGRSIDRGQGRAFAKSKKGNLNSRWGKAGNPTAREFQALLPPDWRSK